MVELFRRAYSAIRGVALRELLRRSGLFDRSYYLASNPDVATRGIDPLMHYVRFGAAEGRDPSPLFDQPYYLNQVGNFDSARQNPLAHYFVRGERRGLRPNPFFDPAYYRRVARVPAFRSALGQFASQPHPARISPSAAFDCAAYLQLNPDVDAAGLNPLWHYLSSGRAQGRTAFALVGESSSDPSNRDNPAGAAARPRFRIDRATPIDADEDLLVLAAQSPDGRLTELQRSLVEQLAAAGYCVALFVASDRFSEEIDTGDRAARLLVVREGRAGAGEIWADAAGIIAGLETRSRLTLANDALAPTGDFGAMSAMRLRMAHARADAVFLTDDAPSDARTVGFMATFQGSASLATVFEALFRGEALSQLKARLEEGGLSTEVLHGPLSSDWSQETQIRHRLAEGAAVIGLEHVIACAPSQETAVRDILGGTAVDRIQQHIAAVSIPKAAPGSQWKEGEAKRSAPVAALFNAHGALQPFNPAWDQVPAVCLPLPGLESHSPTAVSILAVVHCFYVDEAETILARLEASVGQRVRCLLTTDSAEKAARLRTLLVARGLNGAVVVTPNRGRDIAPFLIETARDGGDEEIILHLHTKKSTHNASLSGWGPYLLENLVGSRDVANSVLQLFSDPSVGLVYAEHFPLVAQLRNWGFDFGKAKALMDKVGVRLRADALLDFPTGSMFWVRRSVLSPLLEAGLNYHDFDAEAGQIDGTLAHAVERCILYLTEHAGLRHIKVVAATHVPAAAQRVLTPRASDIPHMMRNLPLRLLGSVAPEQAAPYMQAAPELFPVNIAPSRNVRKRLNIYVPTLKPEKSGEYSSAFAAARNVLAEYADGADVRVIVTSAEVCSASLREGMRQLRRQAVLANPSDDVEGVCAIVGLHEPRRAPLALRAGDAHFATAWWTADLAFRMRDRQVDVFGGSGPVGYFIQDYEPGLYAWSDRFALAKATYNRPDDTVAIIDSEELARFIGRRHSFIECFYAPIAIDPDLRGAMQTVVKERLLVCHGGPGLPRTCFSVLVEGLRRWQAADPEQNVPFRIMFVGEAIDPDALRGLENAECVGKVSGAAYADLLSRAAMGAAFMLGPHPSHPPLEMATAGLVTITNAYETKNLSKRAPNIFSIDEVEPDSIAQALSEAASRVNLRTPTAPKDIEPLDAPCASVDFARLAQCLWTGRGGR